MNEKTLKTLAAVGVVLIVGIGSFLWARAMEGRRGEEDSRGLAAPLERWMGRACRVEGTAFPLPDVVHEASGLALSRRHEGILWTHADAGRAQVLAVTVDGQVRGQVRVTGARVEDWEDVAVGPCPAGSCLFLADIGDNRARRRRITVYRVAEPDPDAARTDSAEAFHATYPDGPQDAEALFLDADGRIHVVTKGETGPVAVYRFPERPAPGSTSVLEVVRTLSHAPVRRQERITGASLSPDGSRVALRTLGSVALFPVEALTGGAAAEPLRLNVSAAGEAQGEGIALGRGDTVYLASEGGRKRNPATLTRVTCPLSE